MEDFIVLSIVVVAGISAMVCVRLWTTSSTNNNARRERELNYREELKNMRMNVAVPSRDYNQGNDGDWTSQLIPLLQNPDIQKLIQAALKTSQGQPKE